ncbi:MAG: hypothetical protein R3A46_09490 [Thermomicrobiales bacterium]
MEDILTLVGGALLLTILVWIVHRLRMSRRGPERNRSRSETRALDEAEVLTRAKGPFV